MIHTLSKHFSRLYVKPRKYSTYTENNKFKENVIAHKKQDNIDIIQDDHLSKLSTENLILIQKNEELETKLKNNYEYTKTTTIVSILGMIGLSGLYIILY